MEVQTNTINSSSPWWQWIEPKKVGVATALFASTIATSALANYAPMTYTLSTFAFTVWAPYTMGDMLSKAATDREAVKIAKKVVLLLAITGIFYGGAITMLAQRYANYLLYSLLAHKIKGVVWASFHLSGVLGYLVPFSYTTLTR